MAKSKDILWLTLRDSRKPVECTREDRGYYLGSIEILENAGFLSLHVEVIEVKVKETQVIKGRIYKGEKVTEIKAVNSACQDRIDTWFSKNAACLPTLLSLGKKQYFVHVEAFAA